MRIAVGLLACLSAGGATIALAGDPPGTPAGAATGAAVSAPAVATPPAAPTAPAPQAATAPPVAADLDFKEKHFLSEGYKVEMHHGQKMFCRREDVLGSRLGATKYCSTLEQLVQTEQDARRAMERGSWQQNNPAGK